MKAAGDDDFDKIHLDFKFGPVASEIFKIDKNSHNVWQGFPNINREGNIKELYDHFKDLAKYN